MGVQPSPMKANEGSCVVILFFPYKRPDPHRDNPPPPSIPGGLENAQFNLFRSVSGPFRSNSVRFRTLLASLGVLGGVGVGGGSVREKDTTIRVRSRCCPSFQVSFLILLILAQSYFSSFLQMSSHLLWVSNNGSLF